MSMSLSRHATACDGRYRGVTRLAHVIADRLPYCTVVLLAAVALLRDGAKLAVAVVTHRHARETQLAQPLWGGSGVRGAAVECVAISVRACQGVHESGGGQHTSE